MKRSSSDADVLPPALVTAPKATARPRSNSVEAKHAKDKGQELLTESMMEKEGEKQLVAALRTAKPFRQSFLRVGFVKQFFGGIAFKKAWREVVSMVAMEEVFNIVEFVRGACLSV